MTVLKILNKETGEYEKVGIGGRGKAATIRVGTVTTGEPGTEATVVNEGTDNDAVLSFVIPRGDQGKQGDNGASTAAEVSFFNLNGYYPSSVDNVHEALDNLGFWRKHFVEEGKSVQDEIYQELENKTESLNSLNKDLNLILSCEDFSVDIENEKLKIKKDEEVTEGSDLLISSGAVHSKIETEIGNINALLATI